MITYQKPTIVEVSAASVAIQGQNKQNPVRPDSPISTSGLAYDLDEA